MYLSKSDFKVARTCPTKLYYRKLRYTSLSDDDPYVKFLADGGYMVEAIAKLLFPEGLEIEGGSIKEMFAATSQALQQQEVTLFQATLMHGQLTAQVDILEKRGNRFRLIEVKAKTVEPGEDMVSPFSWKKGIYSEWKPYVEDVAYQTHILRGLYPNAQVIPCLCVIDKTQTATSETAFENFHIKRRPKGVVVDFQKPEITFSGDVEALRKQSFIRIFDVTAEVEAVLPHVENEAAIFAASLTGDNPHRIDPKIGFVCKKCEYRIEPREHNGFRECWGELADPIPHLLDLYQVGRLKAEVFDDMIERRMTGLLDISVESLSGKIGERQKIQIEATLRNEEFINPKLSEILANCKYPLQFVDFEATRMAVPYHAGMNPYGLVAFQWSCHTIPGSGVDLVHSNWINVNDAYPNFEFAETLKSVVTPAGTVFVWSSFECTVLKDIRKHLNWYDGSDTTLSKWLEEMIDEDGPIVDLYDLARKYYFHPRMGGSVSIKDVLPAIWLNDSGVQNHRWFAEYLELKDDQPLNPYDTLNPLPFRNDDGEEESVRGGLAAIRTYQDMMYGSNKTDPAYRREMQDCLLEYCKLDTAAMVMIWMHWTAASIKQ